MGPAGTLQKLTQRGQHSSDHIIVSPAQGAGYVRGNAEDREQEVERVSLVAEELTLKAAILQ